MPHVGIQRLGPGEGQHDGAHRGKHLPTPRVQEGQAVQRVERRQDGRLADDLQKPEKRQHPEPHDDHRAEQLADHRGAVALHRKQADEHRHRDRDHVGLQGRRRDFQPLHGAEHRDGRRDHAVAIEQGCAEHTGQQQGRAPAARAAGGFGGQCGQRHDAAFAPVVGAQDQQHVFQRHHQHQAPEDDRHRADQVRGIQGNAGGGAEDLFHGVQRAGADVAVHHAHRAEGEGCKALPAGCFAHVNPWLWNRAPLSPRAHQERIRDGGVTPPPAGSRRRFRSAGGAARPERVRSSRAAGPCTAAGNGCAR
jgi:hypothetical protein